MSEVSDAWFVRFPDGRVVRAANTTVVRQQLTSGKIPRTSSVRRSPDEAWTALEWTREFADLLDHLPAPRTHHRTEDADEGMDLGAETRPRRRRRRRAACRRGSTRRVCRPWASAA